VEKPAGRAAIERDAPNSGMGVEKRLYGVRLLASNCGVGACLALADRDDIPQRDPVLAEESELFGIRGRRFGPPRRAEQREKDRPQQIARVGVILFPAQRFLAR